MKKQTQVTLLFAVSFFFASILVAQEIPDSNVVKTHGTGFVDTDGDGYNDNAPDHDGDGIPNGLDPDYEAGMQRKGFVDLDGDGINDNAGQGKNKNSKKMFNNSNCFGKNGNGAQKGNVTGVGNGNGNGQGTGSQSKGNNGNGKGKGGN